MMMMPIWSTARLNPRLFDLLPRQDSLAQRLEQAWRQHAVGILAGMLRDRSQIIAGPGETVQFVQTKPVSTTVELKESADVQRDFDRIQWIVRRRMGNWRDNGANVAVPVSRRGHDNGAWPVLGGFFRTGGRRVT